MTSSALIAPRRICAALLFGAALALSACAQPGSGDHSKAKAAAPAAHSGGDVTAKGAFKGDSNHVTTGTAKIVRKGGKWYVKLADDFTFDGAPDPKVALGDGKYVKEATLAPLRSNTGEQLYEIPASLDVADYNQVWIWCEQFSVPLGHANLTLT